MLGMKRVKGHALLPPAPLPSLPSYLLLKLMTTVTQDNDAHDDSENGGVEYNTCVWCGLARGGAAGDGAITAELLGNFLWCL